MNGIMGIGIVVSIVTSIAFLIWIYRAHKNLPALGARNLQYSPGWAVGWWFIPILNLILPYMVVTEIWKASDPRVTDGYSWRNTQLSLLLLFWWVLWILTGSITWIGMRIAFASEPETVSEMFTVRWALLATDLLAIPAAILAILVVRGIVTRQQQKHGDLLRARRSA